MSSRKVAKPRVLRGDDAVARRRPRSRWVPWVVAGALAVLVGCAGDDAVEETADPPVVDDGDAVDADGDGSALDAGDDEGGGADAADADEADAGDAAVDEADEADGGVEAADPDVEGDDDDDDDGEADGADADDADPFAVPDDPDVAYFDDVMVELQRARAEVEQGFIDAGGVVDDAAAQAAARSLYSDSSAETIVDAWRGEADRGLYDPATREERGLTPDRPPVRVTVHTIVSGDEATGCVGLEVFVDLSPMLVEASDPGSWQYFGLIPNEAPDEVNQTPWKIAEIRGDPDGTRVEEFGEVPQPCG